MDILWKLQRKEMVDKSLMKKTNGGLVVDTLEERNGGYVVKAMETQIVDSR